MGRVLRHRSTVPPTSTQPLFIEVYPVCTKPGDSWRSCIYIRVRFFGLSWNCSGGVVYSLLPEDINRGPGMWIMNLETIKSEQFRHAFKIWWDNWKIEKNKYNDIREWWDLAKTK